MEPPLCSAATEAGEPPPREACGVFGVLGRPGLDAGRVTYFGLYALQHRGQELAGIATSDGEQQRFYKEMGLVAQVFSEDILRQLTGHIACGHNRYSTTGGSRSENAQPVFADDRDLGRIFVAHNGNLVNSESLRQSLTAQGVDLPHHHGQRGAGRPDRLGPGADVGAEDRRLPPPLHRLLLPGADDQGHHLRGPRPHGQPPPLPGLPRGGVGAGLRILRPGHGGGADGAGDRPG